MTTARRRWVPIVGGVAALLVGLGIVAGGVSIVWLREHTTVARDVTAAGAAGAFAAVTQRFANPQPAFIIGADRRPHPAPGPSRRTPGAVTTLHVLAWDAGDQALVDVTLPMWLARLKAGPIAFGGYVSGLDEQVVRISADDIERLGPGVLIDYTAPSGDRVLLSAQ